MDSIKLVFFGINMLIETSLDRDIAGRTFFFPVEEVH